MRCACARFKMTFDLRITNSKYGPNLNHNPNPNSYDNALFRNNC